MATQAVAVATAGRVLVFSETAGDVRMEVYLNVVVCHVDLSLTVGR